MKVLFAVSSESISDAIIKKYQKEYKEILSYKNVYYFNAILKEIQKDKSYDRIVISSDLEPFANNNYEAIDKFLFEKMDEISDEAHDNQGNETSIILISSDRHIKGHPIFIKLFGIGIYNALIGNDRSMDQVCKLINKPRTKKEAKVYYKIDSDDVNYSSGNNKEVSEVEIQNILNHFKRISKNEEKFAESFKNIASQYTDEQLKIIINFLPSKVKMVLEDSSPKYQELMNVKKSSNVSNGEKIAKKAGIKVDMLKDASRPKITGNVVIPNSVKAKSTSIKKEISNSEPKIETKKIVKVEKNIAVSSDSSAEKVKKEEKKIAPSADEMKKSKDENIEPIEEKKGRGRPKKVVTEAEIKPKGKRGRPKKVIEDEDDEMDLSDIDDLNMEDINVVENSNVTEEAFEDNDIEIEDLDIISDEEVDSAEEVDDIDVSDLEDADESIDIDDSDDTESIDLDDIDDLEDIDDTESIELIDDDESLEISDDVDDELSILGNDDSDDISLSMDDDIEEKNEETDDVDIPDLDGLEDYEEEIIPGSNYEEIDEDDYLVSNAVDSNEDNADDVIDIEFDEDSKEKNVAESEDTDVYDENQEELDTSDDAIPLNSEMLNDNDEDKDSVDTIKPKVNYSMSSLNSLLTKDKKVACFIGTSKNGTSFLVNNLAVLFSSLGINTAILDMTQNRNSYYIFTENDEKLRQVAYTSIEKLENGFAEGISVNKFLTVYTALPSNEKKYDNSEAILSTLVQNHSVVLIDCDYNTDASYFVNCQEIYLVQSMDILTIQPLTLFLRELKVKGMLESEKIRVIINKEMKVRSLTNKAIIAGMSFYNDPAMSFMTELFNKDIVKACTIPFDANAYSRYLEEVAICKMSLNGLPKQFLSKLKVLGEMIYPLNGKQTYSNNYNANAFSSNTNNTLNEMKKRF